MNPRPFIGATGLSLAFVAGSSADIIYVDANATGASTGLTWADAHTNLGAGLAAAAPGDEIHIGQGIYRPAEPAGNRNATFDIDLAVTLIGGYAGVLAADPDANDPAQFETILSGDLNGDDDNNFENNLENVFHVVTIDAVGVVLEGLTIRDGRSEGGDPGAGILVLDGSDVTIEACRIQNNAGSGDGVGLHAPAALVMLSDSVIRKNRALADASTGVGAKLGPGSTVTGCTFALNTLAELGGALAATDCTILDSTFRLNAAAVGGGAIHGENLIISGCSFIENSGFGGAVNVGDASIANCLFDSNTAVDSAIKTFETDPTVIIENCVFRGQTSGTIKAWGTTRVVRCDFFDNSTNADGGAILNLGLMAVALCQFNGNEADRDGGAIDNHGTLRIFSSSFSGNRAGEVGGAVSNRGVARSFNSTFAGNRCERNTGGGALYTHGDLRVYNSILWNNRDGNSAGRNAQAFNDDGTLVLRSSIVQGITVASSDPLANSGADPMFRDADGPDDIVGTEDDDLRLLAASPARNSGRNQSLPADLLDLDGDANVVEPSSRDVADRKRIRNGQVDRGAHES